MQVPAALTALWPKVCGRPQAISARPRRCYPEPQRTGALASATGHHRSGRRIGDARTDSRFLLAMDACSLSKPFTVRCGSRSHPAPHCTLLRCLHTGTRASHETTSARCFPVWHKYSRVLRLTAPLCMSSWRPWQRLRRRPSRAPRSCCRPLLRSRQSHSTKRTSATPCCAASLLCGMGRPCRCCCPGARFSGTFCVTLRPSRDSTDSCTTHSCTCSVLRVLTMHKGRRIRLSRLPPARRK